MLNHFEIHIHEKTIQRPSCEEAFAGFTFNQDDERGGGQKVLGASDLYSPTYTYEQEKYILQVIENLERSFFSDGGDGFVASFKQKLENRLTKIPVRISRTGKPTFKLERKTPDECFVETIAEYVQIALDMDPSLAPGFKGMFEVAGFQGYMQLWQDIRYWFSFVKTSSRLASIKETDISIINFNRKALDKPNKPALERFKRIHLDGTMDNGYMVICTGRVFAQKFHKVISYRILEVCMPFYNNPDAEFGDDTDFITDRITQEKLKRLVNGFLLDAEGIEPSSKDR